MVIEPGEERCKAPLIGALKRGSLAMTQSVSSWRVGRNRILLMSTSSG
jgi:hypothetical protein